MKINHGDYWSTLRLCLLMLSWFGFFVFGTWLAEKIGCVP